jgi:hypothetical protein
LKDCWCSCTIRRIRQQWLRRSEEEEGNRQDRDRCLSPLPTQQQEKRQVAEEDQLEAAGTAVETTGRRTVPTEKLREEAEEEGVTAVGKGK